MAVAVRGRGSIGVRDPSSVVLAAPFRTREEPAIRNDGVAPRDRRSPIGKRREPAAGPEQVAQSLEGARLVLANDRGVVRAKPDASGFDDDPMGPILLMADRTRVGILVHDPKLP